MARKKAERKTDECFTLDVRGVAARYDIGLSTARRIGEESGALVKLGSRNLYLVKRIDEYLEKMADAQNAIEIKA